MKTAKRAVAVAAAALVMSIAPATQAQAASFRTDATSKASIASPQTPGGVGIGASASLEVDWTDKNTTRARLRVTDHLCDSTGGRAYAQFLVKKNWWNQPEWVNGASIGTIGCGKTNEHTFTYGYWNNLNAIQRMRVRVCYDNTGCAGGPSYINPYS